MAAQISKEAADYLKEHKVYEKLHDALVYVLEKDCPENFLEELKNFFLRGRVPKVIVLGPPAAGVTTHAHHIVEKTGAALIESTDQSAILQQMKASEKGWVLAGYPQDYAQACALRRAGVYPNCVLRLVISNEESERRQVEAGVDANIARERIENYMRMSERTDGVYASVLQEVDTSKPIEETTAQVDKAVEGIGVWIHPTTHERFPLGMKFKDE